MCSSSVLLLLCGLAISFPPGAQTQDGLWLDPGPVLPSGGVGVPKPVLGDFVAPAQGQLLLNDASGTGSCSTGGLANPVSLAVSPEGTVFVLDRDCLRVTSLDMADSGSNSVEALQATEGNFNNNLRAPLGLSYDEVSGELFIADSGNHRVMRWRAGDAQGAMVVSGSGLTTSGELSVPTGVATFLSGGLLLVLETSNNRLQVYDLATCCATPTAAQASVLLGCAQSADPNIAIPSCTSGSGVEALSAPSHVAVSSALEVYVADTGNHRVLRLKLGVSGLSVAEGPAVVAGLTGMPGCGPEQLRDPVGVAVDLDGYLYVADMGNHRVQKFAPRAGERAGLTVAGECCCPRLEQGLPVGGAGLHQLNQPMGLALHHSSATLLVADRGNRRVLAFPTTGASGLATGEEAPRAPAASCVYGADCTLQVLGVRRPSTANRVLIANRDSTGSPCGDFNCSIPSWPGMRQSQFATGPWLDTYALGTPSGPADRTSMAVGEYALCFGHAPPQPCEGGECTGEDNCTNSSSWLCSGSEPFGIRRRAWLGVAGEDLASLHAWPSFPASPDVEEDLQTFEGPENWGDSYGQVLYGLFVAPETGLYSFHVTSDEHSELRLSSVFNETSGELLAYISENEVWYAGLFPHYGYAQGPDDWTSFATQTGSVELEAGQLYWVEVTHKEFNGVDFLRAGVTLPNGTIFRPMPAELFRSHTCTQGEPRGVGVVHNCQGKTTGQSCTAQCDSGYEGSTRTFHCDGLGRYLGIDPACKSITCEDYNVEVGSFFMHGVLGQVDCSGLEGIDCTSALSSWAGAGMCVFQVATHFSTCQEYCERHGRSCIRGMGSNEGTCVPDTAGYPTQTTEQNGCLQRWSSQLCACGRRSLEQHPCLAYPWCELGLLTPGTDPLGLHADLDGNIVGLDTYRHVAARWRWQTRTWEPVAGARGAGDGLDQLRSPLGLRVADDGFYVADTGNHRLVMWAEDALEGVVVFGTTGASGASTSELRYPIGVLRENSSTYVVDYGNARVLRVYDGNDEGEVLGVDEAKALPLLPNAAMDSFLGGMGRYYRVDQDTRSMWVCDHTLACDFSSCLEVNASAQFGSSCGCVGQATACTEVHGVLPD